MRSRILVALFLGVVGLVSCGGGGGSPSSNGGAAAYCPAMLFTDVTCGNESIGVTCPGTVTCPCGSSTVDLPTSCTCNTDSLGASWTCQDDCSNACADGGPSDGATSPLATCAAAVQRFTCPGLTMLTQAQIQQTCMMEEQMCGATLDAWASCVATAPIDCTGGVPYATGCDAQSNALLACAKP